MNSVASQAFPDSDWVAGLREGRNDLMRALRARLRRGLAAALAGSADVSDADIDDFTQDAMLRVLARLDSFRGESSFATWAMAVAVRVSLTALRRRRWACARLGERLEDLARADAWIRPAHAPGELSELLGALRLAIAQDLTARQRQVLLGELEGIPQVVLAEHLGSTPSAIYKTSHDARKKAQSTRHHTMRARS